MSIFGSKHCCVYSPRMPLAGPMALWYCLFILGNTQWPTSVFLSWHKRKFPSWDIDSEAPRHHSTISDIKAWAAWAPKPQLVKWEWSLRKESSALTCWHEKWSFHPISLCRCCTTSTWWCVLVEAGRPLRATCSNTTRAACSSSRGWRARRPLSTTASPPTLKTSRLTAIW